MDEECHPLCWRGVRFSPDSYDRAIGVALSMKAEGDVHSRVSFCTNRKLAWLGSSYWSL